MESSKWTFRFRRGEGVAKEFNRERGKRDDEGKEGWMVSDWLEEGRKGGYGGEGSEMMKERREGRKQLLGKDDGNRGHF